VLGNLSNHWKSICLGIVCFVAGGMTTIFLSSELGDSDVQHTALTADSENSRTKQKPRFGLSWNGSGNSPRQAQQPDRANLHDSKISVPITLLESLSLSKSTRSIGQPILDENDPVEAALGLTSVEKERILNDWQRSCENLRRLEVGALDSKDLEDGTVLMNLPNLSRERKEIAGQFMDSLNQTLGTERGAAFYATKQVNNMFAADSGERSIAVKVESVGNNKWSYRMSLNDASGSRVWVGDSIPLEIRHLADAAGIFPTIDDVVKSMPED
jgi:hypothetical protein